MLIAHTIVWPKFILYQFYSCTTNNVVANDKISTSECHLIMMDNEIVIVRENMMRRPK
jgi:hypothetical protein